MSSMQHTSAQKDHSSNATQLHDLIGGMIVTQIIYVAAKLGIADQLRGGPKSIDDLASIASVNTNSLYRVLRALASIGIFAETGDDQFELTPQAELLQDDIPGSQRAWAIMLGEEGFWKPWGELLDSVKTGETAFNRVFGIGRWEYLSMHTDAGRTFNRMATSNTERRAVHIVEAYDFSAVNKVIDLGGGRGALMAAILKKHPNVKGLLTDLPAVAEDAKAFIETQGLGERCEVLASNVFESIPREGDIYILKSVIVGQNDDEAIAILKNCRESMTDTAKLLLIDPMLPPHGSPSSSNMNDVRTMVMSGGQERNEEELRALLEQAGFKLDRVIQTGTQDSIFEALPV